MIHLKRNEDYWTRHMDKYIYIKLYIGIFNHITVTAKKIRRV